MTLEQATERLLDAVSTGELAAIGEALDAREAALEQLAGETPSKELAGRVSAAIEAGEAAASALCDLKQRIGSESVRLKQIRAAFVRNLHIRPQPHLDCRG